MKTAGIIAEFNPFHNGHKYLLSQAKELTGADHCAVIMSGDFVQRGGPAFCDKYLRTVFALDNGADVVFELPVHYALGSAEAFAEGAVRLLALTGEIDYLVFGSECGDINLLNRIAGLLEANNHTAEFNSRISDGIKQGLSFPAARANAVSELVSSDEKESINRILSSPNNILAIEYCRALIRLACDEQFKNIKLPVPCTIKRQGQAYDDFSEKKENRFPSAGAIRTLLSFSTDNCGIREESVLLLQNKVPENVSNALIKEYGHLLPLVEDDFSNILYSRLNTASREELMSIPGINPDLMNSIIRHRREAVSISRLTEAIKTKTFTYTAISRALFKIILHTEDAHNTPASSASLRVLGFRRGVSGFLKKISDNGLCRIITTPSDIDRNDGILMQDVFAADLYNQILFSKFGTDSGCEFTKKVIIR